MNHQFFLCLSIILCFSCGACTKSVGRTTLIPPERPTATPKTITIESSILDSMPSLWKVNTQRVNSQASLHSIFFLDENNGWVAGDGVLFETKDGGRAWKSIKLDTPGPAEITDIYFVNPSTGWVVLQKTGSDEVSNQNEQLWLMHTSDGGQSWSLQYEEKGVLAKRVSFADEQNGWLIGIKYIGLSPLRFNYMLLHTSDKGQHWSDFSAQLNHIAANGEENVNSWVSGFLTEGALTVVITTNRGKIFKTIDGGRTWQLAGLIQGEQESGYISRMGFTDDSGFWVSGGAYNVHGVWGMIAKQQEDSSWIKYKLKDVYFKDVFLLSDHQLLACGSMPTQRDKWMESGRKGVILYSSDGGRTWSIVYSNPNVGTINALARVDSQSILAVGENGLILRFDPLASSEF